MASSAGQPAVGQASARQLEGRVAAQPVEVVAIGIAATDCQHAGAQHIGDRMCDVRGIAPVGNVRRKRVRDFAAAFGQRKSITPLSEDSRPPSNAAVTFLRETDGRLKLSWLS